ncbi:tRNA pseudouridine(55) synthase [Rhinocladiella mackenziei CBS 650.93]|uniref:tRNA pseudouridine(55) synthase n=1 Tax=Rhinocladiella mackenziei CBS 650.93 TaxID=1442369 RepID=A0A0D2HCR5_9EURO|nr:tRNA pseudouridine(55) synthase [Rhinocladiella mackenziei CBS 650.93]KIX08263.1 tRNA pseudouridine(55) synthase [Rhinocladiella mackenziei CBS 650.93]
MAQPSVKVLEGVFAISKPPSLSSAQVLRDLQHKFAESQTFAPLLHQTKRAREEQERRQPKRRKSSNDQIFKMGHGGTLDPLATGILIVGIGRGTKHLSDFLGCKKTYETVVLFGKSTDTYDVMGKIIAESPSKDIPKNIVQEQVHKFRGKMKQIPPIYSAIKIEGMKLYDYARSGKELPRELESRDVELYECSLLEFYRPGEHDFRWPAEQADDEEKAIAKKLLDGAESTKKAMAEEAQQQPLNSSRGEENPDVGINDFPPKTKAAMHIHHLPTQDPFPAEASAARIRLTVSSGFYVRSFAHDFGLACGTYGTMASLVRSQQGNFTTLEPVPEGYSPTLTYKDMEAGEDVWGPKIIPVLEKWLEIHPEPSVQNRIDDRDRPKKKFSYKSGQGFQGRGGGSKRTWSDREEEDRSRPSRRRNSSSPEA